MHDSADHEITEASIKRLLEVACLFGELGEASTVQPGYDELLGFYILVKRLLIGSHDAV